MIKYVFFDLDGTLTDPYIGITNSVIYALEKLNITPPERSELKKFIGPPLVHSFMKYYNMTEEEGYNALQIYREYFAVKGLYENDVYDGIPELLEEIKALGYKIVLATSKPEEYSIKILKHFDLYKYFDLFSGATMDEKRVKKAEIISYVMNLNNIKPEEVIMVGDRIHDIEGAKANNVKSIGVLFGYGDKEELAPADYLAASPKDILQILQELK